MGSLREWVASVIFSIGEMASVGVKMVFIGAEECSESHFDRDSK